MKIESANVAVYSASQPADRADRRRPQRRRDSRNGTVSAGAKFSLLAAMDWVARVIDYQPGSTVAHARLEDVVRQRAGVCQDFAHLMISIVRSWGLPARYVMGYLSPFFSEPTDARKTGQSRVGGNFNAGRRLARI